MKARRALEHSSALLRCAFFLEVVGAPRVFAQSSATFTCRPHQGDDQHGDDDDDDDNGQNNDPNDTRSSFSHSWCAGETGTFTGVTNTGVSGSLTTNTAASGTSAGASSATRGGDNADISANGGGISKGSIAGIVIAILVFLIIAASLFRCMQRRYANKRNQVARKESLLGPAVVTSTHPAGTKEGAQMTHTMGNVAPSHPPDLWRSSSRETLPQIPYDTPAYTSTDHLASLSYAQTHTNRTSTVLSYSSPSESTGVTAATAGHGSGSGAGHAGLREDMLMRQKELETNYRRMETGQLDGNPATASRSDHVLVPMNLPEHPPPRYNE